MISEDGISELLANNSQNAEITENWDYEYFLVFRLGFWDGWGQAMWRRLQNTDEYFMEILWTLQSHYW